MQEDLKLAIDNVRRLQDRVDRTWRKNAKKLVTFNLWAAQEKAQHIAEAYQSGEVKSCKYVDKGKLPVYKGETLVYL